MLHLGPRTGEGPYTDSQRLLELPALRKDGEQIHVEMSLSPIGGAADDANGGGRFVLALIRDVTERKRAQEELRESEKHFRLLVEGVKAFCNYHN